MSLERLIYLMVFIAAFGIALYVKKYHRGLHILVLLLALGLLTEFTVEFNKFRRFTSEESIYNLYILFEYIFYAAFFFHINSKKIIRRAILISLPVFIVTLIIIQQLREISNIGLSTTIYNLGGVLTVTWSLWTLFIVKPVKGIKFQTHPLFWICTGLIIFHSVIIPFNLLYNDLKSGYPDLFKVLSPIIQKGLNIVLYFLLTIGFICSHKMKK